VLMIETDSWRAAHKMIELYELDAGCPPLHRAVMEMIVSALCA